MNVVEEGKLVSTVVTLSTGRKVTISHKSGLVANGKRIEARLIQSMTASDRRKIRKALTAVGRPDLAKESLPHRDFSETEG